MKITFLAYGTRGDVQPPLALAKTLQGRGHQVRISASSNFTDWIEIHGIESAPTAVDIQALMASEGGLEWIEHGTKQIRQLRIMTNLLKQHGMTMMQDAWDACQGSDMVISSFTSDIYAASIAEKIGAIHISAPLQPAMIASRSGEASVSAPFPDRDHIINYWFSRWFVESVSWQMLGKMTNRFREEILDLPPIDRKENQQKLNQLRIIQGFSKYIVPHPDDWRENIHTTGYWFLDEETGWQPPVSLLDFLDDGEPPVYIGFGSMTGPDPVGITNLIVEAVERTGQRATLQKGWVGIGGESLPGNYYLLDSAPHRWLFPRMKAVVHHGGAGTTAESLRAGTPTMIVPHLADQPFWGRRVATLGAGPKPINRNRLTSRNLAAAIRQATTDQEMRRNAASLGEKIRGEDGIKAAVVCIEAAVDS